MNEPLPQEIREKMSTSDLEARLEELREEIAWIEKAIAYRKGKPGLSGSEVAARIDALARQHGYTLHAVENYSLVFKPVDKSLTPAHIKKAGNAIQEAITADPDLHAYACYDNIKRLVFR